MELDSDSNTGLNQQRQLNRSIIFPNTKPTILNMISETTTQPQTQTEQCRNINTNCSSCTCKTSTFLYYHAFSRIAYYLLMCPFRTEVELNKNSGGAQLLIQTNLFQKILCGFLNLYTFLMSSALLYKDVLNRTKAIQDDPSSFFEVFQNSMFFISVYNYLYIFWYKRDRVVQLLQTSFKNMPIETQSRSAPLIYKETVIVFFIFMVCAYLSSYALLSGHHIENLPAIFKQIKSGLFRSSGELYWLLDWILMLIFLFPFLYVAFLSHVVLIIFPDVAFLSAYDVGRRCVQFLRENTDLSLNEVVKYGSSVRHQLSLVNKAASIPIFVFFGNALLNLTSALLEILDPGDIQLRLIPAIYSTGLLIIISLAADSTSNLGRLSDYIYNHRYQPGYKDNMETLIVLSEISTDPIGIKAFKFPITYGFVVTILSTGLTYTVILLQFKVSSGPGN